MLLFSIHAVVPFLRLLVACLGVVHHSLCFPRLQVVKWLWEVVREEMDDEENRRFLKFFTGSDRAPIGGLGNLRCIIQRDGTDSNKLPTSHTCFNTLLLPSYKSKEKLTDRLKLAIMNAEGFGLE